VILDTQYLGALVDGNEAARVRAEELDKTDVPTRIPTVVLWEAYTGIGNTTSEAAGGQLRELYERLQRSRSTVELTPTVARKAGSLNGKHLQSDTLSDLDGADSVIAAHGLLREEPVVSNDADFQDVEGLTLVTY
jgi:predicted nucleic acid-binding protein